MSENNSIFVLEDNDFVRMQIVKFLQGADYHCVEATNPADGVEKLQANLDAIQCMLVDVRMEPEDGFDFLNKLNALDIQKPTIMVTGDQNPDILSRASAANVAGVLIKPVNKDRLIQMVARAIQQSQRNK